MTKSRALFVAIILLFVAIGYNTYVGQKNHSDLKSTTVQTCQVQKRGLSAQPHLTKAMSDILALLTSSPPAEPITPKQRKALNLLNDLDSNLISYVGIEDNQPKHRTCP